MKLPKWLNGLRSSRWSGWPEKAYDDDNYRQRLATVEQHLQDCLDISAQKSPHIISMCAGDGRDVINVVRRHPRRHEVAASLVELNQRSVDSGRRVAKEAGLDKNVRFLWDDATDFATYQSLPSCDIVLVCGVWGHVPVEERKNVIRAISCLCKPGGLVVWSRGVSRGTARLQQITSLFASSLWEQVQLSFTSNRRWAVATHRYCGPELKRPDSGRIFHFRRCAGR